MCDSESFVVWYDLFTFLGCEMCLDAASTCVHIDVFMHVDMTLTCACEFWLMDVKEVNQCILYMLSYLHLCVGKRWDFSLHICSTWDKFDFMDVYAKKISLSPYPLSWILIPGQQFIHPCVWYWQMTCPLLRVISHTCRSHFCFSNVFYCVSLFASVFPFCIYSL